MVMEWACGHFLTKHPARPMGLSAFSAGPAGTAPGRKLPPEDHLSIVYMHNTQGERNELFHVKVRDVVYGCIE